MSTQIFEEHELEWAALTALEEEQFVVYYQPQYNHCSSMLVGAEALARWEHPEKGLILPRDFIPDFEANGFITRLDVYMFEHVCRFIRKCLDGNVPTVPVSINLSRRDIFYPGFIQELEEIRKKYDVPVNRLRFEITESSALGNSGYIDKLIEKIHEFGYIVEMDDFGSGYSSLNILQDVNFDIIKLDFKFLHGDSGRRERSGVILSSVVRMLQWLQLPIIAEGVETAEQADYLRSIGCECVQGYLYSTPVPEADFEKLLTGDHLGRIEPDMRLVETMDAEKFWDSRSLETLIFSNYVGGAAIFDYQDGKTEMLRVNQKYLRELGMNLLEKDLIGKDILDLMEPSEREIYAQTLQKAIVTGEEQECETWRLIRSACCGEDRMCIRATVRMIGRSRERYLFYSMIRNITAEKESFQAVSDSERRFRTASDQVNIYCWEYTIATKEMRPCFRCMRDLGMPPLLKNYPESAIEMGVFPPEEADMYRDFMKQIDAGAPSLEAIIPLTLDRIPYHVRYTTEFDENGYPVKAIGSAALVVDM